MDRKFHKLSWLSEVSDPGPPANRPAEQPASSDQIQKGWRSARIQPAGFFCCLDEDHRQVVHTGLEWSKEIVKA